jgi:hypothetical protein
MQLEQSPGSCKSRINYIGRMQSISFDTYKAPSPDWVGDNIDRKCTSGYSLSLGSRPICWSSKQHVVISLSSIEGEYRGVVNITIQVMWPQHFLTKLGI